MKLGLIFSTKMKIGKELNLSMKRYADYFKDP